MKDLSQETIDYIIEQTVRRLQNSQDKNPKFVQKTTKDEILEFVRNNNFSTGRSVSRAVNIAEKTSNDYLNELVKEKLLRKVYGVNKNGARCAIFYHNDFE